MTKSPSEIVNQMMDKDAFSKWMGIKVISVEAGFSELTMTIRKEMVNGFGVCHGGITFAFADSALAFASNSRGAISLALENNINFTKKGSVGDILTALTEEIQNGRSIGVYKVRISNQNDDLVAEFRGTVYRTGERH